MYSEASHGSDVVLVIRGESKAEPTAARGPASIVATLLASSIGLTAGIAIPLLLGAALFLDR